MVNFASNSSVDATSLWQEVSPERPQSSALTGPQTAEIGIIGGGFTGLSCALHLARRGRQVTLIEGRTIGWGGSGRNNGQVIPTLGGSEPAGIEGAYGDAGARLVTLIRDSAKYLFQLARDEGIECEAEQTGWFQPAHTSDHMRLSQARVESWNRRGANCTLLNAQECAGLLGSNEWHGGMYNPTGGHINPLMLARGLAAACERAGVTIFEGSPVTETLPERGKWQIKTAKGSITCEQVLLATNAYGSEITNTLTPNVARSLVPVTSWQMSTEPLDAKQRASIVPGREAVSDTRGDLQFFRYDARNRLIAGGALINPINARERIPDVVRARLQKAYPQLSEPKFTHIWSGYVGVTPDHLPHFHKIAHKTTRGYYAVAGYNGRGVALAVSMGREFAALMDGTNENELALPWSKIRPIPFQIVTRRFARIALATYRRRDTKPPKL